MDSVRILFERVLTELTDLMFPTGQDWLKGRLQCPEADVHVRSAPRHRPHLQGHPREHQRQGRVLQVSSRCLDANPDQK